MDRCAPFRAATRWTQRQALRALAVCRTPALGGHVDVCAACGFERPAYHSCRNRHCPKCQSLAQARWIAQRMARVLDTDYFHVVCTLPAPLRPLALAQRRRVCALLMRAAAQTLLALGHDPQRLGGELGITTVLHTWTRELTFHPHVHCIVTAGGLAPDGRRWLAARQRHLFPVRVLATLFRGKLLAALRRAIRRGELVVDAPTRRALAALHDTRWVVYVKRPFGGAAGLFQDRGRSTHRVGLSNQRLVAHFGPGTHPGRIFSTLTACYFTGCSGLAWVGLFPSARRSVTTAGPIGSSSARSATAALALCRRRP